MAMVLEKMNGAEAAEIPPPPVEKPEGLPPGKYVLVGWDVDTTGRRLVDEICQIAAYSPRNTYSQYIMPYRDLNPGARRRHNIRVVTVGRYRMLKDTITNKILKTKSEISALTDFLAWLEKECGEQKSVILIHHELHRLSPIMLLEALQRYNLVDRFKAVVSGFADSYALASERCQATVKSVSLRVLARVLLDADTLAVESALDRATAAYRIVEHLAQGEQQEVGEGPAATGDMAETARIWSRTVDTELNSLNKLKSLLEKQNTFRPVFAPLLGTQRSERQRVTALRRLLADAGILYEQVKSAWETEKIEGLQKQMAQLSMSAKQEDITELIDILDCHFDPAKESKCLKTNKTPRKPKTSTTETATGDSVSNSETSSSSQQSPSKINNAINTDQQQRVL